MLIFHLAWQGFIDSCRRNDSRLWMLTQTLLVFVLLLLSLSSAGIQQALSHNLDELLGADLVVERSSPLNPGQRTELALRSESVSETRLLHVTLTHGGKHQRVQLKLVDEHYPVKGSLAVGESRAAPASYLTEGPSPGDIWLDARIIAALGLSMGDSLHLGASRLVLRLVLFHEPDRLLEGHSVDPRAMVAMDEAASAQFSNQGKYRYLVRADEAQALAIAQWVATNVPDANVISRFEGGHPLAGFWQRVENFFGMSALVLFILGAVAMDMLARPLLQRETHRQAVYQSLGQHRLHGLSVYLLSWLLGVGISMCIASLAALAASTALLQWMQTFFPGMPLLLEAFHFAALWKTLGLVSLLLLCLQLPSLLGIYRVSIMALLRPQFSLPTLVTRLGWNFACFGLLVAFYSDNPLLSALMLGCLLVSLVLILGLTLLLLTLGEAVSRRFGGLLAFSLFMMRQRLLTKAAQVLGLGLCATLLLFTLMLLKDFGQAMEANSRAADGNLFIVRADAAQLADIRRWQASTHSRLRQLQPYLSAKLVAINGQSPAAFSGHPSDSLSSLTRPVRLIWNDGLPANNELTAGQWWQAGDANWRQVSVEEEVMTDLGLSLGDSLSFAVNDKLVDFTLVAGHAFKAGAGSITFWFQLPAAAFSHLNAAPLYMGSLELPQAAWARLSELWQRHPGLELLPLRQLTQEYDTMLSLVTKLVSGYSLLLCLFALLVIGASVAGHERDDRHRQGLLLCMGLTRRDCLRLNLYESLMTSLLAGGGALVGTQLAGQLIYRSQFNLNYQPDPLFILVTLATMGGGLCLLGLFLGRHSLRVSMCELLAER